MHQKSNVLWLIALFKLVDSAAILALAIGALKLLRRDVPGIAQDWIAAPRIDPAMSTSIGYCRRIVVATVLLIPLEIHEIIRRLVVNLHTKQTS